MITEKDLQEAIAECNGVRNPNANTCIKLASYYTILEHMFGKEKENIPTYSFSSGPSVIEFIGEGEFAETIRGMDPYDVWPIVNELMNTLQIVNPRLFNSVIRKLKGSQ